MQQQINDGSSKRKTLLLANKIGAILSTACGSGGIRGVPFGFDDDVRAAGKTELSLRRPVDLASAILTRKWKTSLRKVARAKLRLKPTTKAKAAATGDESAVELCKKRILMGEKCRALNHSGVLHYDKQGILLPED